MNDAALVQQALAKAVASRSMPSHMVEKLATSLSKAPYPIRKLDVCTMGICIDYFFNDVDELAKAIPGLSSVLDIGRIGKIEIFPWGIINPDLYQVHIEHQLDAGF